MPPRITRNHEYAKILARTVKDNKGFTSLVNKVDFIDSADVIQIASGISANSLTVYDTLDSLPTSSLTKGGQGYVKATQRLYISDSFGWYSAALVNLTPTQTLDPAGNITLSTDGTSTIVTITATDSDQPESQLSYSIESDGNMLATGATVTQDSSVFTITPLSEDSGGVTGNFTLTFKTTDSVNIATTTKDFSLSFGASDITGITLLLVGGGGGGGGSPHGGGGGSGGGLLVGNVTLSGDTKTNITVGDGGTGYTGRTGSPWPSAGTNKGANGGNSSAFGYTATGGGGGGGYSGGGVSDTPGQDGGSGGGGSDESAAGSSTQSALDPNTETRYGNAGGTSTSNTYSKGGGGMGSAGGAQSQGGAGFDFSATFGTGVGVNGVFGGGGGAAVYNGTTNTSYRAGGSGGGGDGGQNNSSPYTPTDGTANTGGGGGGAERVSPGKGGDGGSGVVLVKVLTSDIGNITTTGSPTTHTFGLYTIYEFTQDGSITNGTVSESRYFIDEFTTDTTSSSEYTFANTSTAATWNNSGYIYFNTGDNHSSEIEWTPSDSQPLQSEGRVFAVFYKTADWPSDNSSNIDLKHSNGTDYYRVRYAGSAYQSYITKTISSSVTDTQNINYNFDDQSDYHTFEVQWSSDTIKFYVDGTLEGTLTPSNNTTPIEISSVNFFFTQIQGTLTAIGYQDYGSDGSAYPFI